MIGKNGKPEVEAGVVQTQPDPRYFQTRPSATADNAAGTVFSNLGPNDKATLDRVPGQHQTYLALNTAPDGTPLRPGASRARAQVPVDAADDSASSDRPRHLGRQRRHPGLPDRRRAPPLARHRRQPDRHATPTARSLGFLGEPGVNVLELNLALDRLTGSK